MGISDRTLTTTSTTSSSEVAAAAVWVVLFGGFMISGVNGDFNYKDALTKSLIFLEAQRSGKLPPGHRPTWRGDSALDDGKLAGVDLVGGYYDAGDNVKYGFPMAFTITTLAWSALAYPSELKATREMNNVHAAIRWGTDYFLKAARTPNRLYVQVGDPVKDHECWMRPEDMRTPRTVLEINKNQPGTEIAAETSAALAASSMVFRDIDHAYSSSLLNKAKTLFEFAKAYKGTYKGECPFYCSFSGYKDELLWAATWLYKATLKPEYMKYIVEEGNSSHVSEFNWDNKNAGSQILLTKMYWEGKKSLQKYKELADSFICSVLPESPIHKVFFTPGGLIHLRDGANSQYVTGAALLFSIYSDGLAKHNLNVTCGTKHFNAQQIFGFAKKQMDYLLGKNPKGVSYMVGFGNKSPKQAHHRGASIPKLSKKEALSVNCAMSFVHWYNKNGPNPNELTGAIVGGPDRSDSFQDLRSKSAMTEPTTYTNSLAVGVLANLAGRHGYKPGSR